MIEFVLNIFWAVLLYIVGLIFGVAIIAAIEILPRAISNWLRQWRDRKLQGQGSVVLRRHRARLEYAQ